MQTRRSPSSQGSSHRSYNEGQGRPLTRKTNFVNDEISLQLPSDCPVPAELPPLALDSARALSHESRLSSSPITELPHTRMRASRKPAFHLAATPRQPDLDTTIEGTPPAAIQGDNRHLGEKAKAYLRIFPARKKNTLQWSAHQPRSALPLLGGPFQRYGRRGATNERVRREMLVLIADFTSLILLFGSAQAPWYGRVPAIPKGLDTIVTS